MIEYPPKLDGGQATTVMDAAARERRSPPPGSCTGITCRQPRATEYIEVPDTRDRLRLLNRITTGVRTTDAVRRLADDIPDTGSKPGSIQIPDDLRPSNPGAEPAGPAAPITSDGVAVPSCPAARTGRADLPRR
jgi:hypothetical protein